MYLRHTTIRKDGKVHRYWRLVRSVRVGRRVIQQTIAQLGELDEHGRVEARALARRLIGTPEQPALFDGSEHVTVPVRLKGVRIERSRRFGDVYLALALWRGVGLEELCERLLPLGKERIAWAKMAAVLVVARLCEPSSELHIAEDWYRRTALCDLLQLGDEEVNKDRLYRALDHLLAHKAALEVHLSLESLYPAHAGRSRLSYPEGPAARATDLASASRPSCRPTSSCASSPSCSGSAWRCGSIAPVSETRRAPMLEELARIQSHADIVFQPTELAWTIRLRCFTQPDPAQAALLDRLGIVLPKRMRLAEHELPALARSA